MAANAGAIKAGRAFVVFILSDKNLKKQLTTLQDQFRSVGQNFRKIGSVGISVGGAITTAFASAAKKFADRDCRLADISARTCLSAESLSELDYTATLSGTSLEAVEKAAKKLRKEGIDSEKIGEFAHSI
jgi:dienelactone hydrolase